MFPSSALFAAISCPFSQRGLCERPHCLYKHEEYRDVFGASNKSLNFTGVHNDCPHVDTGAPVNDTMKDECLQELERINKEIESVRHEVELEQRRLSLYQTVQADNRPAAFDLEVSETAGKCLEGGSRGFSPHTNGAKTHSRARKYVVDNSKPRTDLEYDPLSNFSADLRSHSSSGKKGHGLKMSRNAVPGNPKKSVTDQARLSHLPLDDSNEDDDLVIDIPPSPDKKMARDQTPLVTLKDKAVELKVKTMPSLPDSPPLHIAKDTFPPASMVQESGVHSNCARNNRGQSNFYENKECKTVPANGSIIHFPGCLGNPGRDAQKMTRFQTAENEAENSLEPASPPAVIHQQDRNWNSLVVERIENAFLAELPHCELIRDVGETNPLQISNHPPNHSLLSKAAAANSDSQYRQHGKQAQTAEQPAQNMVSDQCPSANVPSELPHIQETSSKIPEQMQGKAAVDHAPTESHPRLVELASGSSRALSASGLTHRAEPSFASAEQHLETVDNEVIIIDSSSEDELNCSEMELSDSDPMEECFRIFMEGNDQQPDVSVDCMDVEKPELKAKPQELSGKKRVAHEANYTEQPLAKSRPQPQVLVPLCVPAVSVSSSQPSFTSRIQQVHQRASMLTVRGGQALISSTCQRRPDAKKTPPNLLAAPVQNAYMNCMPLGTTLIEVGHNLHLILPEGAFALPATSSSGPAVSLLTPICQVQTSALSVRQTYHPHAVTPAQRYRTSLPLIIPAPVRKPAASSASAHSSPARSAATPSTVIAAVKPAATKRKSKQQSEAIKVPHDVRQRYVNMFTEEFLKSTANVNDAFEKALAEERTVYNRSVNKLKYLSIAVNALKRLKNQSVVAAKDQNEVNIHRLKGNIPLNLNKSKINDDMAFYENLRDYVLTEDRLIESNYPVQHPEKPSGAVLFADNKKCNTDPLKRICCRCGATYSVSLIGKHIRKEECNYHYGKGVKNRVPGGVETRYSCCEGVMGAPGCQVFKLHVHDSLGLDGFASTDPRHPSDTSCPGVYSLDCEMCYTIQGLELSRVTLVNSSLQVVYDTFVTPDNEVIDYNTRFSGISEEDVKDNRTSLREVQETLLSFVSSDTILIGHGLETDLCALKLIHGKVVDTSVVFPHHLGPPHKLTLNRLTAEYLRRIIQESVCGHDTAEDAAACMELMLWKVKEDGKVKK